MSDLLSANFDTVQSNLQPPPNTFAAAATISPSTLISFLTGSVAVTTINPPVTGQHLLILIFTGATPGLLTAGTSPGQFKYSLQPVQNVPVHCWFDPVSQLYWPISVNSSVFGLAASAQTQPANPTQTSSATYVMMGLAGAITPRGTKVKVTLSGDVTATNGQTATMQLSIGTGAAPANAAAVTGTQFGSQPTFTALTGLLTVPFSVQAIATGLTPGTAVWVDLALKSSSGNVSVSNLSLTIEEAP